MKNYDVVLYIGDALGDFHKDFEKQSTADRNVFVEKYKSSFGVTYIVLPNPMYGEWEQSLYNYEYSKNAGQKARDRKNSLYPP